MGGFAGAALFLPGSAAMAAQDPASAVLARLAAYSDRVARIADKSEVRLVASIDNLAAFLDGEVQRKAFPYDRIRAEGNVLSFAHDGATFRVENVLPEQFEARVRDLAHHPDRNRRS